MHIVPFLLLLATAFVGGQAYSKYKQVKKSEKLLDDLKKGRK